MMCGVALYAKNIRNLVMFSGVEEVKNAKSR